MFSMQRMGRRNMEVPYQRWGKSTAHTSPFITSSHCRTSFVMRSVCRGSSSTRFRGSVLGQTLLQNNDGTVPVFMSQLICQSPTRSCQQSMVRIVPGDIAEHLRISSSYRAFLELGPYQRLEQPVFIPHPVPRDIPQYVRGVSST